MQRALDHLKPKPAKKKKVFTKSSYSVPGPRSLYHCDAHEKRKRRRRGLQTSVLSRRRRRRERERERQRGEGGSKERSFCTHVGTLSWFMLITSASGLIYHQRHGHVAIPETTPLRKIPPMLMAVSHNRRTPFLGASHTQFCRR